MRLKRDARGRGGRVVLIGGDGGTLKAMLTTSPDVGEIVEAAGVIEAAALVSGADLVLLDVAVVHPRGLPSAIEALREMDGGPAVVIVADDADPDGVRRALDAGAESFLVSWADMRQVHATVAAALDGRGMLDVAVVRPVLDVLASLLRDARRRNRAVIESLAVAVAAKDAVTSAHLEAVSRLAAQLAHEVDREIAEADDFLFGCLLHDVGKIGVPESILLKPGPLTQEEWEVMRLHPDTGARVVGPLGLSDTVLDIVRYHHERWDGGGYPDRLSQEEIPLVARIFSVADALEAMTADRPYRAPVSSRVALERVVQAAGAQFDPRIVAALRRGIAGGTIELVR
jgi:putative nucleotidyltransferase with HDIG domain